MKTSSSLNRCVVVCLGLTTGIFAQRPSSPTPPPPPQTLAPPTPEVPAASYNLRGSVPSGELVPGTLGLSLADAIRRGLRYNLGVISGDVGVRRAAAARLQQLSSLLPDLNGRVTGSSQQVNLAAYGFSGFPGMRTVVGPFEVFDARAALTQAIVDLRALSGLRAARESARSAEWVARDIQDAVVLAVVNLYLQALTGSARIASSEAQVATAEAEYRQAVNQRQAGVAAGIDVLRAQVQLQNERQGLITLRADLERQKLDLARAIGLPTGQQFSLTTRAPESEVPLPALDQALQQALENRADYRAAESAERSAALQKRAAEFTRAPSLYFSGDYGTIGASLTSNHGTYTAALGLQFPIFEGGRIRAAIEQADALLAQRRAELADTRGRIDYEVRTAFLNFNSARDRVAVARQAQSLATEQLAQARDRFAAGVANNLEVVQAQQAVAVSEENLIASLYAFNLARAAIGRAVGRTQNMAAEFLGVTGQ